MRSVYASNDVEKKVKTVFFFSISNACDTYYKRCGHVRDGAATAIVYTRMCMCVCSGCALHLTLHSSRVYAHTHTLLVCIIQPSTL